MSEQPKDKLTDHSYDGIQEYDNPTPGWWTWIFILTVIFSAVYFFVNLMSGGGLGAVPFYERDVVENMKRQYGELGDVKSDAPSVLKLSKDEKWLKVAQSIFQNNCSTCHGRDGEGGACPNLTDEYFINIKKVDDIADVIAKGRNNGAMPAWSTRMQPVEITLLSAYVASIRGANRPGGRAPEGTQIPPWSAVP